MNNGKKLTTESGLILEHSPVVAEKILTPADAAKNGVSTTRHRIQLRSELKTTYPAVRGNDLFAAAEFGVGNGQTFVEKRVAWLNVPATATVEQIQAKLDAMDSPTLVRVLSLKPILSEDQRRTIENGRNPKSYDDYLNDFVINPTDNTAILYKGHKMYRKIVFSKSFAEDVNNCPTDLQEMTPAALQIAASSQTRVPATI